MKLIRAATITVANVKAAAALYAEWLDYSVVEEGVVEADLAASWGSPESAGEPYAVLRPASGADNYIRFVGGKPVPGYKPLTTFGWQAIEICIQDVHAVNERMERSPFKIIGPPKEIPGLPTIHPMQVMGPEGEVVYLTHIKGDLPDYDLPRAASFIDKLFILVLGGSDMQGTKAWFANTLGLKAGRDMDIVYTMLNDSFSLPDTTTHTLCTMIHERDCFLELDQFPAAATPRPQHEGALPPGFAMGTFKHPDFDGIKGDWITPPVARSSVVYAGGRVGTLRDPDGTLVEVVEAL